MNLKFEIIAPSGAIGDPLRATAGHAVWIRGTTGINLYYCSAHEGRAHCQQAHLGAGDVWPTGFVNEPMVVETPAGLRDVLWTNHLGVILLRCVASPEAPAPVCTRFILPE